MKIGLIFLILSLLLLPSLSYAFDMPSDMPIDLLLNGKTSLDKGDYENALKYLADAYEKFPALGDYILFWRAKAYEGKGDIERAYADINTIKQNFKDSPIIKSARKMELELSKNNGKDLAKLFEGFIKDYPSEFNVMYAYAMHLKENNEIEKAKKIFRDIYVSASPLSEKAKDEISKDITIDDLIKRGENLNNAWVFKEAEAIFNEALKRAEKENIFISRPEMKTMILEGLAYSLFRQKRYKDASKLYEQTKNDYWLARSFLRARDIESFELRLSGFMKAKDRRFAQLLISYGTMKRRDGDKEGALKILNNVLEKYPSEKENVLWAIGWTYYMNQDFKNAFDAFSQLYNIYGESKYLYWKNKCSEKLNGKHAAKTLHKSPAEKDFYSFLPMLMDMNTAQIDIGEISSAIKLNSSKTDCKPLHLFQRVDILSEIGLKDDAANELLNLSKKAISNDEILSISCYLKRLDRHKPAIGLASRIPYYEGLSEILYPMAFANEVAEASKQNNIDPLLILSVMREESRFDPNARSIAGAVGLLQLMPETAFNLNKKINAGLKRADDLYNPLTNIMIGSYYLKNLLQDFKSLPLAIASYNAGESAVREWIKKGNYSAIDEFIEDIPYDETRNYVKKVLTSYFQYNKRHQMPVKQSRESI